MKVIVDTSIWSSALRRQKSHHETIIDELESLINDFRVQLIGPIRQEILSGIRSEKQFKELKNYLGSFPDYQIRTEDYELAAGYFNLCRKKGVQGSNTDYLICAVAVNNNWQIFTTDQDFTYYERLIPINLYRHKLRIK